jgi:hypothetical protein
MEEMSLQESLDQIQKSLDELKDNDTATGVIGTVVLVAATVGAVYWITGKVIDRKVKRRIKKQEKEQS